MSEVNGLAGFCFLDCSATLSPSPADMSYMNLDAEQLLVGLSEPPITRVAWITAATRLTPLEVRSEARLLLTKILTSSPEIGKHAPVLLWKGFLMHDSKEFTWSLTTTKAVFVFREYKKGRSRHIDMRRVLELSANDFQYRAGWLAYSAYERHEVASTGIDRGAAGTHRSASLYISEPEVCAQFDALPVLENGEQCAPVGFANTIYYGGSNILFARKYFADPEERSFYADEAKIGRLGNAPWLPQFANLSAAISAAIKSETVAPPVFIVPEDVPNRLIRDDKDAELSGVDFVRWLGFADAQVTNGGADGGVDIVANGLVGQVKYRGRSTSRPDVQRLAGVACVEGHSLAVFLSMSPYTPQAIEWANRAGLCLFRYDRQGRPEPVSAAAHALLAARNERGSRTF